MLALARLAGTVVLAHQGGWDEILMVLTPIAVFGLLLKLANTRARQAQAARATADRAGDETGPDGDAATDSEAASDSDAATGGA